MKCAVLIITNVGTSELVGKNKIQQNSENSNAKKTAKANLLSKLIILKSQ